MAEDLGNGVSRTLSAAERQFQFVVWQADKPPLDSELNLVGQVSSEKLSNVLRSNTHSGFFNDPLGAEADFVTSSSLSNRFFLGRQASGEEAPILWASVNGWMIPVAGTLTPNGNTSNQVNLFPPPSSDTRIDLVFLEVWQAQVSPNPSSLNKPSSSTLWKYGNTLFGGTNLPDDLEDPNIGIETTERVQLQYRLRVFGNGTGLGASVDLSRYPDGLDDPNVRGQGAGSSSSGFQFFNMRDELGDPSLWRAGDGDPSNSLGTIDGYTYAIPVCAVFRRNSQPFVAIEAGNANQNGSVNRNPFSVAITNPLDGSAQFGALTLTSSLPASGIGATGAISVTGLVGSGFDNPNLNWASTFIVIDDEIIGLDSVSTAGNTITINAGGRGRWGTQALPHAAGTPIRFFNWRQDGLFADEIAGTDILDLRRSISLAGWDYQSILIGNLTKLFKNQLHSSYKQSGVSSGDVQGVVIPEIDTLFANGAVAVPAQTEALDGPDGIRTVFSDASVVQSDVTVYVEAPTGAGTVASYAPATGWEVAADFVPDGFGNTTGWSNGTILNLYIGGQNGNSGARRSVRTSASNRIVRFLTPREAWLTRDQDSSVGRQTPVTLRFIGSSANPNTGIATEPSADGLAASPGPVYPLPEYNFEKPFVVLGGLVNSTLLSTTAEARSGATPQVVITGVDFDTPGVYYPTTGVDVNDPTLCSEPLLHATRTLWDMLTAGGTDLSGKSSELYLVLYGDTANPTVTNGVFRVIGAGTVGYTTNTASAADRVVVEFIREVAGPSQFLVNTPGLTAEFRSQYTHTEDDDGRVAGPSALTIVLTDLAGTTGTSTNPWNGDFTLPLVSDLVVNTSIIYGPSRGGTARVADDIHRFAVVNPTTDTFVRVAPSTYDSTFSSSASVPSNEAYFPPQPIQTWNRLSSLGLSAPNAPSYGGKRVVFTEQDREAELFVDEGSKSVFFRPLVKREMTLVKRTVPLPGALIPATYPNGNLVDPEGFFVSTRREGYALPPEFVPRFGRQDIPFHTVDPSNPGGGSVLFGLNHLFCDSASTTDSVFNILVGRSAAGVTPSMLLQTDGGSGLDYGEFGPISGGQSGYQGRLFSDVNVISSDTTRGMRGIQLPPFLGCARVYGVYDARDWAASGGNGAFSPDRISPSTGGAKNLLRTGSDKQTLFLLQGGAQDYTGNAQDHTYIIPSNAIDIRLSPSFTSGEAFEDLNYVVEFIAFGFSRGFITNNNYVLARASTPISGGTPAGFVNDLNMIIHAPAKYPTQTYVGYSRTVYQGDPYMTRAGSVRVTSDYQTRYGQVPVASAQEAGTPIQQFDLNGNQIPEKVNPRALQVLASVDFYTTLGTGKIGGRIYPGTPLDVGHLQSGTRVPSLNPLQALPRTFTEGQDFKAPHASATVAIINNALAIAGNTITLTRGSSSVTFTGGVDFTGASSSATARALAVAINGSSVAKNLVGVTAEDYGLAVRIVSTFPGASGNLTQVKITPRSGLSFFGTQNLSASVTPLMGGEDIPANGTSNQFAPTPVELTGLSERLPLGILMQDSDFAGEDPLHDGSSIIGVRVDAGNLAASFQAPMLGGKEYSRSVGGPGSFVALSDGSILEYTPYNAISSPTGARSFRLFRGGGSAYVIGEEVPGGPVEFSSGSFSEEGAPVLKSAILAGKALLVRNFHEEAFSGSDTTTEGDELQMIIVTQALLGEGHPCTYTLSGEISPTGYGEGYAAADRYRLAGKPLSSGHPRMAPPVDVPLAPYPSDDPNEPNPCA